MTQKPGRNRRSFLGSALAAVPLLAVEGAHAAPRPAAAAPSATTVPAVHFGITPSPDRDQTAQLQAAIDQTSAKGLGLELPPGRYVIGGLQLRPGTRLLGAPGATVLSYNGIGLCVTAENAAGVRLEHVVMDGGDLPLDRARTQALLAFRHCLNLQLTGLDVGASGANGIHLSSCSGRISDCDITSARDAGIWSQDADPASGALVITGTTISDCRDNGILIWRTTKGHDGSRVVDCTLRRIGNKSGGSGQYGNGINVFRAGNVAVANSRISDCAYSAVRGNAADNIQMLGNSVARIGEVALYAEFGFEGAMISNNIVDGAATGIAVTNFNEGGRLAVIQGNLIRNLVRREHETVDKRGDGIAVEADAVVSNNVVEGAPTAGLMIGWGPHLRDVVASGNLIRASRIGIAVSGTVGAGRCLIANNMISGHSAGAIRAMDFGRVVGEELAGGTLTGPLRVIGNVG